MKKIPEWQYPLYHKWDRKYFRMIENLGRTKKYPKIIGDQEDIDVFLKMMIRAQKMENWRAFFKIIEDHFKKYVFDIRKINEQTKDLKIPEGVEPWAIFDSDKRICQLNDEIGKQEVTFVGTHDEIFEFILRFIASQFTFGWQVPLIAVFLEIKDKKKIFVKNLNNLLKTWDYTHIFENSKCL